MRTADSTVRAERRIALVIGNGDYRASGASLPHPPNDAKDISALLVSLGFEVETVIDATRRDMDLALQRFARAATSADAALFFYAGHAMQFQGRNFLMPTDGALEDEISLRYETVSLEAVRAALDRANGVRIIILDACRDNPFANRLAGAFRGGGATRGLARIDKTQGMVVAYATAAGDVADDGSGRNSPFTTALLRWLKQPGLEIEMMFRRVASDVNAQTGGRQRPETYISLLSEFYLNHADRDVWDSIKDNGDAAVLHDFVNKYPASPFAMTARDRLALLEREELVRRQEQLREQERLIRADQLARQKRDEEERKRLEAEALSRQQDELREQEQRSRAEKIAAQKREEEEQKRRQEAMLAMKPAPVARPAYDPPEVRPGQILRDCSDCPELVAVPAGEFLMGSKMERDAGGGSSTANEGPQHKVLIRQPMAVGRFEVTRDQFEAFARASGHKTGDRCYTLENNVPQERTDRSFRNPGFAQTGAHPAVCVNWPDAKAYVEWLSRTTGKAYRLLSEAEWEYAARGGSALRHGFAADTTGACKFANGADQSAKLAMLPGNYAYMNCTDGHAYTAPVGSYQANAFGLFDLLGNVWEWTEDCFYDDHAAAPGDGSARSPVACSNRTVRGGSWFSTGESLRPAVRGKAVANARYDDVGFRVARSLAPPSNADLNTAVRP